MGGVRGPAGSKDRGIEIEIETVAPERAQCGGAADGQRRRSIDAVGGPSRHRAGDRDGGAVRAADRGGPPLWPGRRRRQGMPHGVHVGARGARRGAAAWPRHLPGRRRRGISLHGCVCITLPGGIDTISASRANPRTCASCGPARGACAGISRCWDARAHTAKPHEGVDGGRGLHAHPGRFSSRHGVSGRQATRCSGNPRWCAPASRPAKVPTPYRPRAMLRFDYR